MKRKKFEKFVAGASAAAEVSKKKPVQGEKPKEKDIPSHRALKAKIARMRAKIKNSPIADKYKEEMRANLKILVDEHKKSLKKVDTDADEKVKSLSGIVKGDIEKKFENLPEIKLIREISEKVSKLEKNYGVKDPLIDSIQDQFIKALEKNDLSEAKYMQNLLDRRIMIKADEYFDSKLGSERKEMMGSARKQKEALEKQNDLVKKRDEIVGDIAMETRNNPHWFMSVFKGDRDDEIKKLFLEKEKLSADIYAVGPEVANLNTEFQSNSFQYQFKKYKAFVDLGLDQLETDKYLVQMRFEQAEGIAACKNSDNPELRAMAEEIFDISAETELRMREAEKNGQLSEFDKHYFLHDKRMVDGKDKALDIAVKNYNKTGILDIVEEFEKFEEGGKSVEIDLDNYQVDPPMHLQKLAMEKGYKLILAKRRFDEYSGTEKMKIAQKMGTLDADWSFVKREEGNIVIKTVYDLQAETGGKYDIKLPGSKTGLLVGGMDHPFANLSGEMTPEQLEEFEKRPKVGDGLALSPEQIDSLRGQKSESRENLQNAISTNPNLKFIASEGFEMSHTLSNIQRLFVAGIEGNRTEDFVAGIRSDAYTLKEGYARIKGRIPMARADIARLKSLSSGAKEDPFEKMVKQMSDQLDKVEKSFSSVDKLVKGIENKGYHADTFAEWFVRDGVVILAAIAGGVAAAMMLNPVLAAVAGKAFAVTLLSGPYGFIFNAAAMGAGSLIAMETTRAISGVAFDTELKSHLQRAVDGDITYADLLQTYAKEWGMSTVTAAIFMKIGMVLAPKVGLMAEKDLFMISSFCRGVQKTSGFVKMGYLNPRSPMGRFLVDSSQEIVEESLEALSGDGLLGTLTSVFNSLDGRNVNIPGVDFKAQKRIGKNTVRHELEYSASVNMDGLVDTLKSRGKDAKNLRIEKNVNTGQVTASYTENIDGHEVNIEQVYVPKVGKVNEKVEDTVYAENLEDFGVALGDSDGNAQLNFGLLSRIKKFFRGGPSEMEMKQMIRHQAEILSMVEGLSQEKIQLLATLFPEGIEVSDFEQLSTGNCYYLAALHSIKKHPLAPYIFASAIAPVEGGWNVEFSGYDPVFVPADQLNGKKEWDVDEGKFVFKETVKGQLGDKILVLAHAKWRRREKEKFDLSVQGRTIQESEGGFSKDVLALLLKNYISEKHYFGYSYGPLSAGLLRGKSLAFLEKFGMNLEDYIVTAATPHDMKTPYFVEGRGEFKKEKLIYFMDEDKRFVQKHAYSIVSVDADKKLVTVVNPHDTKMKKHVLSYDEFLRYFSIIDAVKLDSYKISGAKFMQESSVPGELGVGLRSKITSSFEIGQGLSITLGDVAELRCFVGKDGELYFDTSGAGDDSELFLQVGEEFVLGRERFTIFPGTVSGIHAKIKNLGNGRFLITDLGSTNGTLVKRVDVARGIFDHKLDSNQNYAYDMVQSKTLDLSLGGEDSVTCIMDGVVMNVYIEGKFHTALDPGRTLVLGRARQNFSSLVSGRHVKITNYDGVGAYVQDLGSTNGTTVRFRK